MNLIPNQTAIAKGSSIRKQDANPNFQSWRTGEFVFEDTPVREVLHQLKEYYKEPIFEVIPDSDCRLTVKFEKMESEKVKELIARICDLGL